MVMLLLMIQLASTEINAQDAVFSQHFSVPLYLNPAFAGSGDCSRLAVNSRFHEFYQTYHLAFDHYSERLQGGIGLMLTRDLQEIDNSPPYARSGLSAIYAYHMQLAPEHWIHFSMQAGIHHTGISWNNLRFPLGVGSETPPDVPTTWSPDLSAGILFYGPVLNAGLAAHHLNEPSESFFETGSRLYRLPMKFTAHLGAHFSPEYNRPAHTLLFDWFLSPQLILQHQGSSRPGIASFNRVNAGLYGGIESIMAGIWYRYLLGQLPNESNLPAGAVIPDKKHQHNHSFVFLAGIKRPKYQLGISYDFAFSGIQAAPHNTIELSLTYFFNCPPENIRRQVIKVPLF